MAQVVGRACAICGERIATTAQGGFCTACRAPVHRECARRAAKGADACAACGAPARRAEPEPPRGPPRASPQEVRTVGAGAILFGLAIAFLLRDYQFRVGIPVPWLGYVAVGVGLLMLAIPSAFEKHMIVPGHARWIPAPSPARAASKGAATSVTFEGAFEPPKFRSDQRPFPLRGKGRLAIHAHGLEASGTRMLTISAPAAILLGAAIPTVTVPVASVGGAVWLAVLLVVMIAGVLLLRRRQRLVTIAIPWGNVHGFLADPKGRAVRILVRKMKPSGEVWFTPADGPSPLLSALLDRGAPEESEDLGL